MEATFLAATSPMILETFRTTFLFLARDGGGLCDELGVGFLESTCRHPVIFCCVALRYFRDIYASEANDRQNYGQ